VVSRGGANHDEYMKYNKVWGEKIEPMKNVFVCGKIN
jgi:hypothetical protein